MTYKDVLFVKMWQMSAYQVRYAIEYGFDINWQTNAEI